MSNLREAMKQAEIGIQHNEELLINLRAKIAHLRQPGACSCQACRTNLENWEGILVPQALASIGALKCALYQLRDMRESEG